MHHDLLSKGTSIYSGWHRRFWENINSQIAQGRSEYYCGGILWIIYHCFFEIRHEISKNAYEARQKLNRECPLVKRNKQPCHQFGSKLSILGVNFRHCLPVVPRGALEEVVSMCLNKIDFWDKVSTLKDNQKMQASGDTEFKWIYMMIF